MINSCGCSTTGDPGCHQFVYNRGLSRKALFYKAYDISWTLESVHFYAQKQLLLSARLSHRNSVCLSVSVRLSHGWISQKRCKLGSPNLHCRLPGRL